MFRAKLLKCQNFQMKFLVFTAEKILGIILGQVFIMQKHYFDVSHEVWEPCGLEVKLQTWDREVRSWFETHWSKTH